MKLGQPHSLAELAYTLGASLGVVTFWGESGAETLDATLAPFLALAVSRRFLLSRLFPASNFAELRRRRLFVMVDSTLSAFLAMGVFIGAIDYYIGVS